MRSSLPAPCGRGSCLLYTSSKDQLLRAAYYETARNGAKIENYLAQSVLDNAGKAR